MFFFLDQYEENEEKWLWMGRGSRLLISFLHMISAPLIFTWFLNGASVVKLMRRWKSRRGLPSQSSCDLLLKGNYRMVPGASSLLVFCFFLKLRDYSVVGGEN